MNHFKRNISQFTIYVIDLQVSLSVILKAILSDNLQYTLSIYKVHYESFKISQSTIYVIALQAILSIILKGKIISQFEINVIYLQGTLSIILKGILSFNLQGTLSIKPKPLNLLFLFRFANEK